MDKRRNKLFLTLIFLAIIFVLFDKCIDAFGGLIAIKILFVII